MYNHKNIDKYYKHIGEYNGTSFCPNCNKAVDNVTIGRPRKFFDFIFKR